MTGRRQRGTRSPTAQAGRQGAGGVRGALAVTRGLGRRLARAFSPPATLGRASGPVGAAAAAARAAAAPCVSGRPRSSSSRPAAACASQQPRSAPASPAAASSPRSFSSRLLGAADRGRGAVTVRPRRCAAAPASVGHLGGRAHRVSTASRAAVSAALRRRRQRRRVAGPRQLRQRGVDRRGQLAERRQPRRRRPARPPRRRRRSPASSLGRPRRCGVGRRLPSAAAPLLDLLVDVEAEQVDQDLLPLRRLGVQELGELALRQHHALVNCSYGSPQPLDLGGHRVRALRQRADGRREQVDDPVVRRRSSPESSSCDARLPGADDALGRRGAPPGSPPYRAPAASKTSRTPASVADGASALRRPRSPPQRGTVP